MPYHIALNSPDSAIRALIGRYQAILEEMAVLRQTLTTYVVHNRPVEQRPPVSPMLHYSMLDDPDCGCPTCMEWELRRAEFVAATALVPKSHKWTVCGCPDCRFVGRIQLNFLAATNRRDLLIEMSYHARYHSPYGAHVMAWLEQELQSPAYTINWCAQEMSRYPLERWLKRCEMAVSGAVSGAVFRASTMVTDLSVHMASSLTADVDVSAWV